MNKILHTKYGTAKIDNTGYYRITSRKEGNNNKSLHRLIAKDYFGDWIDEPLIDGERIEIHHLDENPLNNCVLNLLPIPVSEHRILHMKGKSKSDEHKRKIRENHPDFSKENHPLWNKHHSEESKQKMSEAHTGKTLSEEHKQKISESRNTSGYFRVSKHKDKKSKQGFYWIYSYYENSKRKAISATTIDKLEEKVKAKGLEWMKITVED